MSSMKRKQYVMGNWKMNGDKAGNRALISGLQQQSVSRNLNFDNVGLVVCPPSVYIQDVQVELDQQSLAAGVGAQNVSRYSQGAYTGELSATMLKDTGCDYVLVGHSERRTLNAEDDLEVADKVAAALEHNITAVLCVGETLEQYTAGTSESVVREQIVSVVAKVGIHAFENIVIAYEPVWAIGTGKVATPDYAQRIHAEIRAVIAEYDSAVAERVSILYGGSVNASNAASLFGEADIDGALVGGASLDAEQFIGIALALSATEVSLAS